MRTRTLFPLLVASAALAGCDARPTAPAATPAATDEVAAERAKLSPADRTLADAQEWCAVMTEQPLGSMGKPVKLSIKGEPVFVCCKGCQTEAEADPDKTLAKVAELKAKKAAGK